MEEQTIPTLPQDIIEEILLKVLDVKSLTRFKTVSKSWCSSISSKQFMEAHPKYSSDQASIATYIKSSNHMYGGVYVLKDPLNELFTDWSKRIGRESDWYDFEVVGYSNGLCCIMVESGEFILWNPCTGKFNELPLIHPEDNPDLEWDDSNEFDGYGFGFDEANNDYKIFLIISHRFIHCTCVVAYYEVKVYSLKTNCWRTIEDFEQEYVYADDSICKKLRRSGKLINGKLHWCDAVWEHERIVWKMYLFDLSSELHGTMELPSFIDGRFHPTVEVLNGCLCLISYCQDECCKNIWIMKEYGVMESFYKLATVPYREGRHSSIPMSIKRDLDTRLPICITQDLEILYCDKSTFTFYNPETKTRRDLQCQNPLEF